MGTVFPNDGRNGGHISWADSEIENAAVIVKVRQSGNLDELTPEQREIWLRIMFKAFTIMESNYLHHRASSMDDDVFEAKISGSVGAILNRPAWWAEWERAQYLLPEFKEFMNTRIRVVQSAND